jgi:hypothetical protein
MFAINQTIFGNGDDGTTPGNCMQAALASLLELPLNSVPHIALFGERWGDAVHSFLSSRGMDLRVFNDWGSHQAWWEAVGVQVYPIEDMPITPPMLAVGKSNNGPWSHVVVWEHGEMLHDPHPNGLGLKGDPYEYWLLTART